MLSTAASNALLKTLEEPPEHVVFVLATTEPEKVLPTIRSRTQHFEFNLLPADVLADHVRHVIADAGLELGEDVGRSRRQGRPWLGTRHALRARPGRRRPVACRRRRSRSTTSSTRSVVPTPAPPWWPSTPACVPAATPGCWPRRSSRRCATPSCRPWALRPAASPSGRRPGRARSARPSARPRSPGRSRPSAAPWSRCASAPDPRIPLEVALVQLARPEAAGDTDALARRVEALERALASGVPAPTAERRASDGRSACPPTVRRRGGTDRRHHRSGRSGGHAAGCRGGAAPAWPSTRPRRRTPPSRQHPTRSRLGPGPTLGAVKRQRGAADAGEEDAPPALLPPRPRPPTPVWPPTGRPHRRTPAAAAQTAGAAESAGLPSPEALTEAWESEVLESLQGAGQGAVQAGALPRRRWPHGPLRRCPTSPTCATASTSSTRCAPPSSRTSVGPYRSSSSSTRTAPVRIVGVVGPDGVRGGVRRRRRRARGGAGRPRRAHRRPRCRLRRPRPTEGRLPRRRAAGGPVSDHTPETRSVHRPVGRSTGCSAVCRGGGLGDLFAQAQAGHGGQPGRGRHQEVEGSAGGGMVRIVATGAGEVRRGARSTRRWSTPTTSKDSRT